MLASTFATRSATRVVIVNEDDVPGAIAGAVLARANLAPVLLSPASGCPASVKAEVARLGPAGAFVIGDAARLNDQVIADLTNAGVDPTKITRIPGDNAGIAQGIATAMDVRTAAEKTAAVPAFDAAVIANPTGPDAAAATALAAARRLPLLYVSAGATPAQTSAALTSLNITKTLVIGGPGQVSDAVMAALPSPTRLGGADQYATSRAVATESVVARGLPSNIVYVADGARPMDSALLGAVVGRRTGIMVLAPSPLYSTAASAVSAANLGRTDRIIFVGPSEPATIAPPPPAAVPPPPPPPPPLAPVATCGKVKLVKTNASRTTTRVDTRVLAPCAGKLTATASSMLRVRRTMRKVTLKPSIRACPAATGRSG